MTTPTERRPRPWHLYALTGFMLSLAAEVADFFIWAAIDSDYSARFGTMTPEEFAKVNLQMEHLSHAAHVVFYGLVVPLDLATIVLAIRALWRHEGRGATPTLIVAILAGLAVAVLLMLAVGAAGGGMIG